MRKFSDECYKYDIATDKWTQIKKTPRQMFSFNLVPFSNRYILIVATGKEHSDTESNSFSYDHDLYDYKNDEWIVVPRNNEQQYFKADVQVGALAVPLWNYDEQSLQKYKENEEYLEFVYFGGIGSQRLYD